MYPIPMRTRMGIGELLLPMGRGAAQKIRVKYNSGAVQPNMSSAVESISDGKLLDEDFAYFINDNQQLHIEEVDERHVGRYSCVAENIPGRVEKDMLIQLLKPPVMLEQTKSVEVQENETITLTCPVESTDESTEFEWSKHGLSLTQSSNLQMSSSGKLLHIMRSQISDSGSYVCVASNEAGEDDATFDLFVLVPPSIKGPSFRQIESILNHTVQLQCLTNAIPEPDIEWFRDGQKIFSGLNAIDILKNGSVLRIIGIQTEHEGRYTCVATNKVGRAEADSFVQVIAAQFELLEALTGSKGWMSEGIPPPKVEWWRNGEPMEKQKHHFSSSGNTHWIHFRNVQLSDASRYTCIATNLGGETRQNIALNVLVPPSIADGERIMRVAEAGQLALDCVTKGHPTPEIVWKKEGISVSAPLKTRLLIANLTSDDNGRYTCEAKNEAGVATADYVVEVLIKPRMKVHVADLRVIEGERAKLECKADGYPEPSIKWMRGGRPITDMTNFILSPRGETLMILKTKRSDGGVYSCVVTNSAGETEAPFTVTVLTAPHIEQTIDQNPRVINNNTVVLDCPVLGYPEPEVVWFKDNEPVTYDLNFVKDGKNNLKIHRISVSNKGRYTCQAKNEVGSLNTDYQLEVLAPPKFGAEGQRIFEVVEGEPATVICPVEAVPLPNIEWLRGINPIHGSDNVRISSDAKKVTIMRTTLHDGGKYTCKATNIAGSTDIDLILKVLVPPHIDKSNLINNPLGIFGKEIFLECPASGIPQPTIIWTRDGTPINFENSEEGKYSLHQGNQSFSIAKIDASDQGRYTCEVHNKGGRTSEQFSVEVLVPPQMEDTEQQKLTKREGDALTLICPIKGEVLEANSELRVTWAKDGRPLESIGSPNYEITNDGRRLQLMGSSISDAGQYKCVASNRAGETHVKFNVDILCNHLASEYCRQLEHRHMMEYKRDYEKRRRRYELRYDHDTPKFHETHRNPTPTPNTHGLSKGHFSGHRRGQNSAPHYEEGKRKQNRSWAQSSGNGLDEPAKRIKYRRTMPRTDSAKGSTQHSWHSTSSEPTPLAKSPQPRYADFSVEISPLIPTPRPPVSPAQLQWLIVPTAGATSLYDFLNLDGPEPAAGRVSRDFQVRAYAPRSRYGDVAETKFVRSPIKSLPLSSFSPPVALLSTPPMRFDFEEDYSRQTGALSREKRIHAKKSSQHVNNLRARLRTVLRRRRRNHNFTKPIIDGSRNEQDPHIILGHPITLWCPASGNPLPKIRWYRNGIEIDQRSNHQNYRILDQGQGIEISKSVDEDDGIWTCEAENAAGTSQLEIPLDVWVEPTVKVHALDNNPIKPVGSSITLFCNISGNPPPVITWMLNDQILIPSADGTRISLSGYRLDIPRLQTEDAGDYYCVAQNEVGNTKDAIAVDILVPPLIDRDTVELNPHLPLGRTLTLFCDAKGEPTPILSWYINDTLVEDSASNNYRLNVVFGENRKFIQVPNVTLSDKGVYRCEATNSAGTDELVYKVDIFQSPTIYKGGTEQVTEGKVALLECNASGEPTPLVTWQRNGVRVETGLRYVVDDRVLKIIDTRSSDSGIYVCVATNEAGTDQQAFTLEVLIAPKLVSTSANSTVALNGNASLRCAARGYPIPKVLWSVDDDQKPINEALAEGVEYVTDDNGAVLHLISLKHRGNRMFNCAVVNDAGMDEIMYSVRTIAPPLITKDGVKVQNVTESETVKITCDVGRKENDYSPAGADEDETTWQKDGTTFEPDHIASQYIQLNVGVPPKVSENSRKVIVKRGELAELWCEAVGIPPPKISWFKDNISLLNSDVASEGDIVSGEMKRTAFFSDISPDKAGVYTCKAENWAGVDYMTVDLVVLIPPEIIPDKLNVSVNLGETIVLPCNASGIPEPVVSWVKAPHMEIFGNEDSEFFINNNTNIVQYKTVFYF
ncbi:immunoglobulin i-set domain-containing protein [Ditylenchus destructor]|nr:immunoglobulin i-set domain-containing protein [Ditylenchus destructor]